MTDPARSSRRKLRIRDAHLVGIGGSGMRALAELMRGFGCRITGSDATLSDSDRWRMHADGLRVCAGHKSSQLPDEADVLIHSPAVPSSNPERRAAASNGIPQLSLSKALGWLMKSRVGLAVAGTHGKTTTTALLGHLLDHAGVSPSVVCGGELCDRARSGWAGLGKTMVVEACEYREHFLDLTPQHAILLNIEADHFDCFASLDDAVSTFGRFTSQLPQDGLLIANRDCPQTMRAARESTARVVTVGRHPQADWRVVRRQATPTGWSFVVEHHGQHIGRFRLPSPVEHNVMNALAAIAMAHHLGISPHLLQAGTRTFAGVRRRFETIGTVDGVTLIDDYAHHPAAITAALRTVRERRSRLSEIGGGNHESAGRHSQSSIFPAQPAGRIWCAFQPHQVSRTKALLSEFATSLAQADEVLIPPIFAAREQPGDDSLVWAKELVRLATRRGVKARFVPSLDEITQTVETEARPGDVFLTLGAGDIDTIPRAFARRLRRQAS